MTLTDLVRGHGPRRPKTANQDFHRLVRLVRPSRQSPPSENGPLSPAGGSLSVIPRDASEDVIRHDASEESTALRPESGSGAVPFGDIMASDDVFHRAVAITEEVLQSVRGRTSFSVTILEMMLGALLESLQTSDVLLLPFFSPGGGSANPAPKAVNVCALSLKIGTQLNYAPDQLRKLGLAALLYEAGFGRTQKDEAPLVQGLGARYAGVTDVVVQLRERTDGVRDTEIHEHAHIVFLAGLIESLTRRRPARSGLGPSEAIKEVLQRERGTFPDKILKALIRILATLPVGSLVRLNTGEICRVVAKNDSFPLRPMVVVLVRRQKRLPEPTPIDLSQNPFLHIEGFVTEEMLDREAVAGVAL